MKQSITLQTVTYTGSPDVAFCSGHATGQLGRVPKSGIWKHDRFKLGLNQDVCGHQCNA